MRSAQLGDCGSDELEHGRGEATDEQQRAIAEAIQKYSDELLRDARLYAYKFGPHGDIQSLAQDVLQDAMVTSVRTAYKFDPSRPARPWLRTIIMNQARTSARNRRTERKYIQPVGEVARGAVAREDDPADLSDDELFGLLGATSDGADQHVGDGIEETLALVDEPYREVLRLVFCEGFEGADLGAQLGISPGAAYTRKCRAVDRLRRAYSQMQSGQEGT